MPIEHLDDNRLRLRNDVDLLDTSVIANVSEVEIIYKPIVTSTNQHLLDNRKQLTPPVVCLSELQTSGRGRLGRSWHSPFAKNLYISYLWHFEAGIQATMGLSLAVGISIVKSLENLGYEELQVKWPNDIYHRDQKLAGILIELANNRSSGVDIVVGIGLNIEMEDSDVGASEVSQPWTSLESVPHKFPLSRSAITACLVSTVEACLNTFASTKLTPYLEDWIKYDLTYNQEVKVLVGQTIHYGIAKGIDERGAILVEINQEIVPFIGGEISLRKAASL